jgi:hypothetical protein
VALYALSRLALLPVTENRGRLHDEAERVLRDIHEQVHTHPGAIHYTIHATDVDGRADNALDIVERYGEIAPHVPHVLHMPTHIYVRLGQWPEVIDWNLRSADAALEHPAGDAVSHDFVSHHFPHATDELLYTCSAGRTTAPGRCWKRRLAKDAYQCSFISTFHLAAMSARYALERRQWEGRRPSRPGLRSICRGLKRSGPRA